MKAKYGIGFLAALAILMAALSGAYQMGYNKVKQEYEAKLETREQKIETVTTDGQASAEETYYICALNGYVVVYRSDKKSLYEYTNIRVDMLPLDVQKEVEKGKEVEGLKDVYGFLENYSS
ncbi:hypothetical protein [Lachnoclostridium sp. An181]|uniref:hypothetical protein n=1 Tax=Lachnoclostridium sp. An181 TaxID=1965575 RepID=UPI000B38BACA|nr:hypothetical protein [Lachnoclostridium sp. An181]OUP50874.1 hypothetical protein B5F18_01505 [Lachnoclostridium sp. An181]